MTGRTRITAAIVAAVALIVLGIVAIGGSGGGGPGTSSTAPNTPPGTARKSKRGRQGVRHGKDGRPDQPAPGTGALLGIADQKPQTFSDPTFRALGVNRSRLVTPWNSIFTEPTRLAAWLNAARADGVEPLVAFEHARGDNCPTAPCIAPPAAQYERALRAFRARYPWVTLIQPWNEANSATQPTGKRPDRAAVYYEIARRVCPSCTIPAADVLDGSNLERWLARFRAVLGAPVPRLWGLHNYGDSNRFRDSGTTHLLSLVPGEIWITEAGGIVSFRTADGKPAFPYDEQRAARATGYLFRLAGEFKRITRIYIYQWKIDFPGNRFDAGLVAADGRPRPALAVIRRNQALLR